MSITETVQAFLTFQHSILETIHATRSFRGAVDADSIRLYERTTHFFDTLLLVTVESYSQAHSPIPATNSEAHPNHPHTR
jgi:hypothetical protein